MEIVAKPHLLNLCTKYAMKLHKKLLAEKLMELAAKLTNEDDDAAGFRVNKRVCGRMEPIFYF
jgi:hypothetical protein